MSNTSIPLSDSEKENSFAEEEARLRAELYSSFPDVEADYEALPVFPHPVLSEGQGRFIPDNRNDLLALSYLNQANDAETEEETARKIRSAGFHLRRAERLAQCG